MQSRVDDQPAAPKGTAEWDGMSKEQEVVRPKLPEAVAPSREIVSKPTVGATAELAAAPVVSKAIDADDDGRDAAELEEAVAGVDRRIKTMRDWLDANQPESKEDGAKRERMERSRRIISAVGDGLSALGNMFFVSQYAPSMYNHSNGGLRATNGSIERAKAERDRLKAEYEARALKLGELESERARTVRELQAQWEAKRLAKEKAAREAEAHEWEAVLQPDKQRSASNEADYQESRAVDEYNRSRISGAEADAAEEYYGNRADVEGEKVNTERSKQNRNNRPPKASTPRGSKPKQNYTVETRDKRGNVTETKTYTYNNGSSNGGNGEPQEKPKPTGLEGRWK